MNSTTAAEQIANRPQISATYIDPVDAVWLHAASEMGMQVKRDPNVFASWDGRGTLSIGVPESLDADDCLAQMVLHEVCHALVEGPAAIQQPDWGIRIDDPTQRVREHACLRLQAALTTPHGLRQILAATTTFRKYYDALPEDPLAAGDDPAIAMAVEGWKRAVDGSWTEQIQTALTATSLIANAIQYAVNTDCLWSAFDSDSKLRSEPLR